jgi:MarR family transcriptional regulator, organic hydroperoxide resistance regulator
MMFNCRKKTKAQKIQEILNLGEKMSRLFYSPDLDQWRQLNVPMAQFKTLFLIINRQPENSRTLAKELGVTPGNVTGIVDRLAEQEMVVRKPDPVDRRIIWLEATPKGKELFMKLMEYHTKQFSLILGHMKAADLDALATGIKGLVEVVESHMDEIKKFKE